MELPKQDANPFEAPAVEDAGPPPRSDSDPYVLARMLRFEQTRNVLLSIAGLHVISGLFNAFVAEQDGVGVVILIFSFTLAAFHLAFWAWAKKSPFYATFSAFLLFVLVNGLAILANPMAAFSIINVVIFIALLRGLKIANELRRTPAP